MGEIQEAWAQKQKDDSRGMAYKDPTFPGKEIHGICMTLETDETYGVGVGRGGESGVHRGGRGQE